MSEIYYLDAGVETNEDGTYTAHVMMTFPSFEEAEKFSEYMRRVIVEALAKENLTPIRQ